MFNSNRLKLFNERGNDVRILYNHTWHHLNVSSINYYIYLIMHGCIPFYIQRSRGHLQTYRRRQHLLSSTSRRTGEDSNYWTAPTNSARVNKLKVILDSASPGHSSNHYQFVQAKPPKRQKKAQLCKGRQKKIHRLNLSLLMSFWKENPAKCCS